MHGEPGHRAIRRGRRSLEGEWYAVTTASAEADLRPVAAIIIGEAKRLVAEGLIQLYALVVMPDHCHLLFELTKATTLARVLMLLKGRSSRAANQALRRDGPLWDDAFHDRLMRNRREAEAAWWYIVQNPVRRGLVGDWEDYPYTYARPLYEGLAWVRQPHGDGCQT